MLYVIGISNCNKIQDTKAWLAEREVEYEFIDIKKEPLTKEELNELVYKIGLDALINKKGMMWRKLGLAEQELSEPELFDILLNNQNMMKRPIMVLEEAILVGYDEEAFDIFIKENTPEENESI